jgi:hypothetical protein
MFYTVNAPINLFRRPISSIRVKVFKCRSCSVVILEIHVEDFFAFKVPIGLDLSMLCLVLWHPFEIDFVEYVADATRGLIYNLSTYIKVVTTELWPIVFSLASKEPKSRNRVVETMAAPLFVGSPVLPKGMTS